MTNDKIQRRTRGERPPSPSTPLDAPEPLATQATIDLKKPSLAEVRRIKRRNKRSASKTIYFSDEEDINKLEIIVERFPRSSVSSIINQLVNHFLRCAPSQIPEGSDNRSVSLGDGAVVHL